MLDRRKPSKCASLRITPAESKAEPLAMSFRDLTRDVGLCRRTLEKLVAAGQFPAPRRVGSRLLFIRAEVSAWLTEQAPKA